MTSPQEHIVVFGTQPEWLSGLRGPMLRDFVARGYRVTAIGAEEMSEVRSKLDSWGIAYIVVPLRRAGLNPLRDLGALITLFRVLRHLKPDLLLAYTVKPIVYGLPIAWLAGVRRIYAMITGRGYSFLEGTELSRRIARLIAMLLYRFSLRFADGVMFHNEDDRKMFAARRMLGGNARTKRIWGSGIDLDQHVPRPLPPLAADKPMLFLMIGRLIRDKGAFEFAEAAHILRERNLPAICRLIGPTDPSPNAVPENALVRWQQTGAISYGGPVDDVRGEVAAAHVVVLPSYAEGLPRSVLEGMAAGRAIITTRAPGCVDTVEEGRSGLLVPAREAPALADAMAQMIENPQFMESAGERSLALARERFEVGRVNNEIAEFLGLNPRQDSADA